MWQSQVPVENEQNRLVIIISIEITPFLMYSKFQSHSYWQSLTV